MKNSPPLIFVVAGEASGDNIGARLMASIRYLTKGHVRFAGVGGPAMEEQGLQSIFPMSDLAVMGIVEVIPHLPRLIFRLNQTVKTVKKLQPAILVTIDSPGFCLRVCERVKRFGVKTIHYVAPQLWAWYPARGEKLGKKIDHLLALLPFEETFFAQFNVGCTFVGHPIVEYGNEEGDGEAFRKRYGIHPEAIVAVAMPGSRAKEVRRLLPIFCNALQSITAEHPSLVVVIPALGSTAVIVRDILQSWDIQVIISSDTSEKPDLLSASDIAITKSGTSTLELALAGIPMVVGYKVSAVTAFFARRLLMVKNVSLVNLLLKQELVPEFLQENCQPELLARELRSLITNNKNRFTQKRGLLEVAKLLGSKTPPPSERAAYLVMQSLS